MTTAPLLRSRIAILGATSHIAKGLIQNFCAAQDAELLLYARKPGQVEAFLAAIGCAGLPQVRVFPVSLFTSHSCDAVINCVGIGSPTRLRQDPYAVFELTEEFDAMVLGYLKRESRVLYLSLSSGAAYGTDFSDPPGEKSPARFNANALSPTEFYGIAKLCSEAKHRALKDLNIVDLRVFGYFSRFIDLGESYLLSELVSCLKNGEEFVTGPHDLVRDYLHPDDLAALVRCLLQQERINDVFDVYSAAPAGKFEIIEELARMGALKYRVTGDYAQQAATGTKNCYYSLNRRAGSLGYTPTFSSLDCVLQETGAILGRKLGTR